MIAGVALTIAVIAAGLYYVYEKGKVLQADIKADIELERQRAVDQFGTTCENANAKIAEFVYNELKPGLSALSAEGQGKDERHLSLLALIEKHAAYASYCGRNVRYPTGDRDFESAEKLIKLTSGLKDMHTYLAASRHENCDSDCRALLLNSAANEFPKLDKVLVADWQWQQGEQ